MAGTPSTSPTATSAPSWPRWTSPPTDKRDRAERCADCADQSCPTCQSRLQDARGYDHLAARIFQAAEAQAARRGQPEPGSRSLSPGQEDRAAGIEAGQ